jgi:predicted metal-dependent peptidase
MSNIVMTPQLKVSRALTNLLVHHPFYASMAMSLNIEESQRIKTMATDGKNIWWNAEFVEQCSEEEVRGVIVHEILHVVLKHMLRRGDRDHRKWNIACDHPINHIVADGGWKLPAGGLKDPKYREWMAEKVYEDLPDSPPGGGGGMVGAGSGIGEDGEAWGQFEEPQMSEADMAELEQSIDQKVQVAANTAKSIGKLPGFVEGIIAEMENAQVDWRSTLRRFLNGDQPDDYSMRRPNRRLYHMAGIIGPTSNRGGAGNIVIGIDTSGSVSDDEIKHFLSEISAISEDTGFASLTIIYCDTMVQNVENYESGDVVEKLNVKGRGGTRVTPVFEYVREKGIACDQMVYCTDLEVGDYPKSAPYPVLWLATESHHGVTPPFGQVVRFKM